PARRHASVPPARGFHCVSLPCDWMRLPRLPFARRCACRPVLLQIALDLLDLAAEGYFLELDDSLDLAQPRERHLDAQHRARTRPPGVLLARERFTAPSRRGRLEAVVLLAQIGHQPRQLLVLFRRRGRCNSGAASIAVAVEQLDNQG